MALNLGPKKTENKRKGIEVGITNLVFIRIDLYCDYILDS